MIKKSKIDEVFWPIADRLQSNQRREDSRLRKMVLTKNLLPKKNGTSPKA